MTATAMHPERVAVELTCPACGRQYTTFARTTTRCPGCRRGQRIPWQRRALRDQAAATQPSAAAAAVAEPVPELPAFSAPANDLLPVPAEPEPESDPESNSFANRTMDAIGRAVYFSQPSSLTAPAYIVREAERIIREIRKSDEPSLRYRISPARDGRLTLRLWSDSDDDRIGEAVVVPAIADAVERVKPAVKAVKQRIRPKRGYQACEYCGAQPLSLNTQALYLASGGALDRPRILCSAHARQEEMAGAELRLAV